MNLALQKHMNFKAAFFLTAILFSFTAQAEIVRFVDVSEKLYRGSQPDSEADYAKLKEKGIETIINLRWDKSVAKSKEAAEALGFKFYNVPIRGDARPTEEDIQKVFKEINSEPNGKVYVHCTYGKDRTGLVGALYRVNQQGWSVEDAKKEWIKLGFAHKVLHGLSSFFNDHAEGNSAKLSNSEHANSAKLICPRVFKAAL
ncbi:MAG: tyrosine-protein phosphatase [Bdellovibrionota bacterium]